MSKILYLTNFIRRYGMMQQALTHLQEEEQFSSACTCHWLTTEMVWDETWEKYLLDADIIMLKWMGSGLDTPFLKKCYAFLQEHCKYYYVDAAGTEEGEFVKGFTAEQLARVKHYANFGAEENYRNLWFYLDKLLIGEEASVAAPNPIFWCGIYHPRASKVYDNLAEYMHDFCDASRPTVGILFYREEWVWGDLEYQSALIEALERQGLNAIAVFSNGMPNAELGMPSLTEVVETFFCMDGVPIIETLISAMKFSLTATRSMLVKDLQKWNIPVLAGYTIMSAYEDWAHSFEGMNAMEVSISISLPEFDGVIHGVPIASKKVLPNGDVRYIPIPERIERMASKAKKWALLRRKENADKKVAIIFHNYPPRNSNIGSALGLDTLASVRLLLAEMQRQGYKLNWLPSDTQEFIELLTKNATNDKSLLTEKQIKHAPKLSGKLYKQYFATLAPEVQAQMCKDWGEAPGEVMEFDGDLLIPGVENGNVFITVQPARGFGENPEKLYHDPFTAPTHHYLAFYKWLRDVYQADVVAHIGTHGNLEWLPGKNAGLSASCYPDLALGELPNIYPYNMTITGEGIQAKRRGAACLIEHLPAPQAKASLYDTLDELDKILDEYLHFEITQPENLDKLEELVLAKVKQAELTEEVAFNQDAPFKDYVMALHNYLSELKNMEVHTGLHILGEAPKDIKLVEYLALLLQLENGDIPSLYETLGEDYQAVLAFLEFCKEQDFDFASIVKRKELTGDLLKITQYLCEEVYPHILRTSDELTNILQGMNGCYIEPGPSGAPSAGGAGLLPTGRNFFGVDPRTLPTPAAWELGKALGDAVIERFIEEEGRYPENIGLILWSGSNMRSHGQCVAEFLYLMGVRPRYQSGTMRIIGLEVMNLDELKRPRIDVTARISGLFRDAMPALVNLLDRAVQMAAAQDEDLAMNYVRKHVMEDSQELSEQEGLSKDDAWREASYRIFGDEQGTYGAGVAAVLEAKNWQTIDDLADVYVRWGAHAYGGKTKGKFLPQRFRKRMATLDIAIKNEDNHETNMLSSDDYNAYHGGMIAAVRSIKGSAPKGYCGDTTNHKNIELHSVQEQAKRIFRTESINPKYIEGMMEHGYKGAADLANMLAHSFQWDATSEVMEDWMYEKYAEKYTFDKKVQEWLREVNPWALQRMTEILLEAERRGLWNAKEETKEQLEALYLDMEGEIEERADDE